MFASIDPVFVFSGLVVGLLVGQTGVGGGAVMTPLLVLAFGVNPVAAVGTDLLFAAATKSAGSIVHGVNHTVNWRLVGLLALGSVPAAVLVLAGLADLPAAISADAFVRTLLGAVLFLTAAVLLLRQRLLRWTALRLQHSLPSRFALPATVALGAVLGLLVSLTSVGAGALGIPALLLLYPRQRLAVLVGSDIAHAVPLTLLAGAGHWWLGTVEPQLLLSLLCGSLPGVVLGSQFAAHLPETLTRIVLAALLAGAGAQLLF